MPRKDRGGILSALFLFGREDAPGGGGDRGGKLHYKQRRGERKRLSLPSSSSDSSSFSLRGARRWRKGGKDCHDIRIRLLERVLAALPPTEPTAVIAVPLPRRIGE